jgi:hypothetical protein
LKEVTVSFRLEKALATSMIGGHIRACRRTGDCGLFFSKLQSYHVHLRDRPKPDQGSFSTQRCVEQSLVQFGLAGAGFQVQDYVCLALDLLAITMSLYWSWKGKVGGVTAS